MDPAEKPAIVALHHSDRHPSVPNESAESMEYGDDPQWFDDESTDDIDLDDYQADGYDDELVPVTDDLPDDDGSDDDIALDDGDEQPAVADDADMMPGDDGMTDDSDDLRAMPASDGDDLDLPDENDDTSEVPSTDSASEPPMPIQAESHADGNDDADGESDGANVGKPTGLKWFVSDFIRKAKNEIGNGDDGGDEDEDEKEPDTDDGGDGNASKQDLEKDNPDEGKDARSGDGKPQAGSNAGSFVGLAANMLALPFKALMSALHAATALMRMVISLCSLLSVLALAWLVFNVPVALHAASSDFPNDEGTLAAESVRYDSGKLSFTAVNKSDMIAHADIEGSVKAWKPFANLPSSLVAPVKVMDCTTEYVDMDPHESKQMTLSCDGGSGFWMRPSVRITGE